jgi:hypothetical protein
MIQLYLFANAFFYFAFACLCLIRSKETARFLGYAFLSGSGKTEYLTVYSGMEFGFSVFLALCALNIQMRFTGLVFCVVMYLALMIVRPLTALVNQNLTRSTYILGTLEYLLGLWGIFLLFKMLNKIP